MSVLVKNMDMPKSCRECNFIDLDEDIDRGYFYSCAVTGKCVSQMYDCRDEDCPLIEIPTEHGRLIDADALEQELTASDRDIYVHEWLEEMPTIIAPSKGVTECK